MGMNAFSLESARGTNEQTCRRSSMMSSTRVRPVMGAGRAPTAGWGVASESRTAKVRGGGGPCERVRRGESGKVGRGSGASSGTGTRSGRGASTGAGTGGTAGAGAANGAGATTGAGGCARTGKGATAPDGAGAGDAGEVGLSTGNCAQVRSGGGVRGLRV